MTDLFQKPEDARPLDPQEREALLQRWITHRKDLNEAEQENIVEAAAINGCRSARNELVGSMDTHPARALPQQGGHPEPAPACLEGNSQTCALQVRPRDQTVLA